MRTVSLGLDYPLLEFNRHGLPLIEQIANLNPH